MLMTATQVGAIEATVGLSGIIVPYLKVLVSLVLVVSITHQQDHQEVVLL